MIKSIYRNKNGQLIVKDYYMGTEKVAEWVYELVPAKRTTDASHTLYFFGGNGCANYVLIEEFDTDKTGDFYAFSIKAYLNGAFYFHSMTYGGSKFPLTVDKILREKEIFLSDSFDAIHESSEERKGKILFKKGDTFYFLDSSVTETWEWYKRNYEAILEKLDVNKKFILLTKGSKKIRVYFEPFEIYDEGKHGEKI